jgi:hypothetical protein
MKYFKILAKQCDRSTLFFSRHTIAQTVRAQDEDHAWALFQIENPGYYKIFCNSWPTDFIW